MRVLVQFFSQDRSEGWQQSVYVDETIELFDVVSISAGVRGLQILIAPEDYLRAIKGTIGALADLKTNAL